MAGILKREIGVVLEPATDADMWTWSAAGHLGQKHVQRIIARAEAEEEQARQANEALTEALAALAECEMIMGFRSPPKAPSTYEKWTAAWSNAIAVLAKHKGGGA